MDEAFTEVCPHCATGHQPLRMWTGHRYEWVHRVIDGNKVTTAFCLAHDLRESAPLSPPSDS